MRLFPSLAAVMLLTACNVPIVEPQPRQLVSARFTAGAPQAGNMLDANWWAQFGDPQLSELMTLARANNPDLRSAAASVMKARALAGQTAADLYPQATGTASSTAAGAEGVRREITNSGSLDASWEIDLFGRTRLNTRSARMSAAAEEAAFGGAYVSLSAEVADYYVQYRACQQIESLYRAALASQRDTRGVTRELTEAGIVPDSDRALADAYVASAAISLESQTADCRVLAQSLAVSVGIAQGQADAILGRGSSGIPRAQAFRVTAVPADALRQRPDVIEAEFAFASAMLSLGAARADLFPSLTLGGTITATNPATWQFGPALSLPIFDAGKRRAAVSSSNADAIIAGETYRRTVLSAVAEVEGALTRLRAAQRNEANAREAVAGYRTNLEAVDNNWRIGFDTLLSREEARRSLQNAQVTEVQQRAAEVRQWIALFKALGGGWYQRRGAAS